MKRRCPACDADSPKILATLDANTIVRNNETYRPNALELLELSPAATFPIVRCSHCNFVYAHDEPTPTFLARLYNEVIDSERASQISCSPAWVGHQLQLVGELLSRLPGGARMLDYGCGDGTVVAAVNATGLSCIGFEPHPRATATTLPIVSSRAELEAKAPFDAILLSDVLEHVLQPREVLRECRDLLAAGGWLCINVPDFNESRLQWMLGIVDRRDPVPPELNPWEHVNYFSPETLARLVQTAGFTVHAEPAKHFGLRGDAKGLTRFTNVLRSIGRMAEFALAERPGSTKVFAQRR